MRLSEAIRRTVNYNPNSIGDGRLFYGILSDQKPDWFDTNQQAFVHNICYDGRVAEIYDVLMTQDIEHIQSFQQYMIQEYNSSPREFYPIVNAFAEGFGLPTVPQLIKMVKEQEQIEFERRQRQEMERQRKKEQEEKERKRKQRQENKERREREQEEKEQERLFSQLNSNTLHNVPKNNLSYQPTSYNNSNFDLSKLFMIIGIVLLVGGGGYLVYLVGSWLWNWAVDLWETFWSHKKWLLIGIGILLFMGFAASSKN